MYATKGCGWNGHAVFSQPVDTKLNELEGLTRQSKRAMEMQSTARAKREKTCIDCHKGIAHRLPDRKAADAS